MTSATPQPPPQQQPEAHIPTDVGFQQQQQPIHNHHQHHHQQLPPHHLHTIHPQHPAAVASQAHALAVAHAAEAVSVAAANAVAEPGPAPVNPQEVGWLFVQQYYTFLNKEPKKLHCFFNSKSSFVHGMEGESLEIQQGQKEIQSRIAELDFEDCKVLVSNVDSQLSHNGCIVIMVLGEMSNKQAASHKFCQCFVLAEQPSGYFVYNDIFRFLKEDIDNEYEEPSDPFGNVDYYHNQQHQHPFNAHSHHPALDIAPQAPAVATQTPSASAARAPSPVPAALPFQRGRSPSPKKLETPQPAATILAAPADALEKTRSPSLAAAAISETAVLVPATPPTSADKKGSDAFAGSWAESVPTPVVENVAATTSKNQEAIPSSPAKAQVAAAVGAKKKNQAQASSVANAVGSPLESVAPAKPKTWATLAAGGAVATAATGSGAAVNVVEKPESPNPVAGKTEIKAPLNKAGVPLVVKKMPIPQGSPSSPGGSANDEQIEFREVQRKPASGPHGGNNSNVNGNRNYNNHQYQQKQLTKGENISIGLNSGEDYLRSIFFMLPQDIPGVNGGPTSSSLDEVIIRDFFTKSVGPVVEVMIPRGKPLCFVEFVDAATAALAIGKTVVINGKSITPEQRKPRYTGNNPNNSNHNNGAARGGMRYNNSRVNAANGGGPRPQSQYGQAAAGV